MALIKPIVAGKEYRVSYQADFASGGTTLLVVLWVPKQGAGVPGPEEREIAPGRSGTISGTVPSFDAARRIEIRVDLPDGTGSGMLELSHDGKPHKSERITSDTTWTAIVVPR